MTLSSIISHPWFFPNQISKARHNANLRKTTPFQLIAPRNLGGCVKLFICQCVQCLKNTDPKLTPCIFEACERSVVAQVFKQYSMIYLGGPLYKSRIYIDNIYIFIKSLHSFPLISM